MTKGQALLGGMGLGALTMYALDPQSGNRRRAVARDKAIHTLHEAAGLAEAVTRDARNRTYGTMAELRARLNEDSVDDDVLVERVRSKMGRVVSHPKSIEVTAHEGRVTLRGPILEYEVEGLLATAEDVRGVREVRNRLDVRPNRDDVPGLQGSGTRGGSASWTPALRAAAGSLGAALAFYGAGRRDLLGFGMAALGLGVAARALTDLEMRRLLGAGGGRRAVEIVKTITIDAPVEKVFAFWDEYSNFPEFMHNVREVTDRGDGRSHWVVAGPAGTVVQWEAQVTERIRDEVLAWRTISGPSVPNSGIVRFRPADGGGTRVEVRLSYNPPGGAVGHGVATLFGSDPKHEMDEDLARMKTLIETGNPPSDAAAPKSRQQQQTS